MIRSERDALNESTSNYKTMSREHRYIGGPPPPRIYRMQLAHEGRARKARVAWDIVDLRTVYAHWGGKCGICGDPVSLETFTIDHIVPLARGGPHLFSNLQPAHFACNSKKGNR